MSAAIEPAPAPARLLVLACGALVNELKAIRELHGMIDLRIECLPATLHLRPERIADELRRRLEHRRDQFDKVLVGYADCGSAGAIDDVCAEFDVERLRGAHCYEFFAGSARFGRMHGDDPTAFYLTDFLARHFDRFVMDALGLTDHPELRDAYFGNYTRLVFLAQTDDPDLDRRAQAAAAELGLRYERLLTGYGELSEQVVSLDPQRAVA